MFGVVLDANVLYPSLLRDVLLELACNRVYRPVWSDSILDELEAVIRRKNNDRSALEMGIDSYITRLKSHMNKAFPDALVSGTQELRLDLPDLKDVHVVACAVSGNAELIVTNNLRDFPKEKLPGDIEAISPSDFLLDCQDLHPSAFVRALGQIAARSGKNGLPINSFDDLVNHINDKWCPGISEALAEQRF